MIEEEFAPAILFLSEDPRVINTRGEDWINIRPRIAGINPVAYVVPIEKVEKSRPANYWGVPIYSWEDPGKNKSAQATQYLSLIKVTGAKYLISLGWTNTIWYGEGDDDFMFAITPSLLEVIHPRTLSRVIHHKIFGTFKRDENNEVL